MKKLFLVAAVASTALFSACEKQNGGNVALHNEVDSLSYMLGALNSAPSKQLNQHLQQNGSDSTYRSEFTRGIEDGVKVAEDKKNLAYYLGIMVGMQAQKGIDYISSSALGSDGSKKIDMNLFMQGFRDQIDENLAFKNEKGEAIDRATLEMMMRRLMDDMVAARTEANKQAGAKFLEEVSKQEGVKCLSEGIYYKEIKAGEGECPTAEDQLVIDYAGSFIDGKEFDAQNGYACKANQFIPGFTQALLAMKPGAEWEVYLHHDVAYGERGYGEIPGGTTLIFKLTLQSVKKAEATEETETEKK